MKKLFSAIALCFVCALALVGCNAPKDFKPKESDFEVSVALDQTEISAGDTLRFTLRFQNNSGYTLKDVTHGEVFLRYSLSNAERDLSNAYTNETIVESLTKKEISRNEERDTSGIPAGKYSLRGYAEFTYHGESYKISSAVYEITIA